MPPGSSITLLDPAARLVFIRDDAGSDQDFTPKKPAITYVLPKDDMAGFEKALYQVKDFLSR
jgi:hypothetical protein